MIPMPDFWATEAAQYIRSISAVEISVCTFAFFGHASDRSLVQSHHEKSQTTYPRAFLRSRNCIRNICDATDEKNHQFSHALYLQRIIGQIQSAKKRGGSTAYNREIKYG